MAGQKGSISIEKSQALTDELNRVLELGRLLYTVLTPEEIAELDNLLNSQTATCKIGNAGDS